MYQGEPIHPSCVTRIQFGDSSRFDPHPIHHRDSCNQWEREVDSCVTVDFQKRTVEYACDYLWQYGSRSDVKERLVDEYRYIGSYKGKHLVLGGFYDTAATGRFSFLTLIKRIGDTIVNAGEITGGDRGHGGIIKVRNLQNNLLDYAQMATPDTLIYAICKESIGKFYPPTPSGVWLIYQVDLDDESYQSQLKGVKFSSGLVDFLEKTGVDSSDSVDAHLDRAILKHTRSGQRELNLNEARAFASDLLENLQDEQEIEKD